jgi:hypothetical protein
MAANTEAVSALRPVSRTRIFEFIGSNEAEEDSNVVIVIANKPCTDRFPFDRGLSSRSLSQPMALKQVIGVPPRHPCVHKINTSTPNRCDTGPLICINGQLLPIMSW